MQIPNTNDLWAKLRQGGEQKRREQGERQHEAYEQGIVLALLRAAGAAANAKQLKQENLANRQSDRLDLEWFETQFPQFPLRLRAAKIAWAHELMADVLLEFEKSSPYKAWTDFVEQENIDVDEVAAGIVFPVPKYGDMVLHTLQDDAYLVAKEQPKKRDRGYFAYSTDIDRVELVLETLPRLLTKLGNRWYQ